MGIYKGEGTQDGDFTCIYNAMHLTTVNYFQLELLSCLHILGKS